MDKSIFENSMKVITSKNEKSKDLLLDKSSKKVQDYFEDMLDTFEAQKRMNQSPGRSFNEFKEEYLSSRKK